MGWSDKGKSIVNDFEIFLKLIIGFGPSGSSEVKWAGPTESTHAGPPHAQPKPMHVDKAQLKVAKSPRQNQVWKP